ncbi:EXS family-domain-containing protein [Blastocladiella britannica]|nr:EXS family-domain-containing protein [Blastocladiella britannica]
MICRPFGRSRALQSVVLAFLVPQVFCFATPPPLALFPRNNDSSSDGLAPPLAPAPPHLNVYLPSLMLLAGAIVWAIALWILERIAQVPVSKVLSAPLPPHSSALRSRARRKPLPTMSPSAAAPPRITAMNGGGGGGSVRTAARSLSPRAREASRIPLVAPPHRRRQVPQSGSWAGATIAATILAGLSLAIVHFLAGDTASPGLIYLALFVALLIPVKRWGGYHARMSILSLTVRALTPSLTQRIHFTDVLFADFATSFARLGGDVYMSVVPLAVHAGGVRWWIEPAIVSVPFLIRFRQCIAELYQSSPSSALPAAGAATLATQRAYLPVPRSPRSRHMANALKYASSFPVIYLSAATRAASAAARFGNGAVVAQSINGSIAGPSASLIGMWGVAAFINTMYSYYWDVFMDWSLFVRPARGARGAAAGRMLSASTSISNISNQPAASLEHGGGTDHHDASQWPPLTRPVRAFTHAAPYYVAIVADFILRSLWILRLSSHVPVSPTFLSAAEIVRRGMWAVLRIEREWCINGVGADNEDDWDYTSDDDDIVAIHSDATADTWDSMPMVAVPRVPGKRSGGGSGVAALFEEGDSAVAMGIGAGSIEDEAELYMSSSSFSD